MFATIGPFVPAARCEHVLSNEKVRAEFDGHGLASIEDLALGKSFHFREDNFSIVIDGREIRSDALATTGPRKGGNHLTYRYASGPYTLEVVYELRPGWRFVSKQLFITGEPGSRFRVNRVTLFRVTLRSPTRDIYVVRRPRPRLQTKDYGAFLRFDGSHGLFVLVQNPFLEFQQQGAILLPSITARKWTGRPAMDLSPPT